MKTEEKAPPISTDMEAPIQTQKKKRKRRKSKQRQAEGGTDGPVAPQRQEERTSVPAGKEGEAREGGTLTPAGGNEEGGIGAEAKKKRKKRKRNKKKPQQETNGTNGTPALSQNLDVTASKEEQQKKPRKRRKKRKLSQVEDSGVSSREGKEGTGEEEAVLAKKLKTEAPEGVNILGDGTAAGEGKEAVEKKNKRKRKNRKKKTNQHRNALIVISLNESKDDATKQNVAADKTKEVMAADTSKVGAANATGNEEPDKKNKRKRNRRKKGKKTGVKGEGEEEQDEEGVPAKKMKETESNLDSLKGAAHTPAAPGESPQQETPHLTPAKKKRMRRHKNKNQTAAITTTDSPTHTQTIETQTATTTATDSHPSSHETPILHPSCSSEENKEKIMSCWASESKDGVVLEEGGIEVIKSPFTCCYIPNLLEDEAFLEGVKQELNQVELLPKNNDLYKFQQTGDLRSTTTSFIARLRELLYTDVRRWLIEVTGIPLSDTVDVGSSRYSHTDVLLCHDDELEGRRLAYILYLVPPWRPEDGGSLDLFSTDEAGHPKDIVRSLVPKHNAFAFFQVSPISFHQVGEVVSRDKTRLSINGWFHGPPLPRPQRTPPLPPPLHCPGQFEEDDFFAWINPMYLDTDTQKEIRRKFCSESELELENFLTDEAYEKLSQALTGEGVAWQHTGPANRQCYEVLGPDMPQEVKDCRQFLQCEVFFLVLSQLTGLKLHAMAPKDSDDEESDEEPSAAKPNPRCRVEAQRWGHRCYTLIRDDCVDQLAALDVYLFTNVSEKWTQELGGHVTYISKDEDEELLTVIPRSRCLSLVYRDAQTLRFTKYINVAALDLSPAGACYHSLAGTYYE